MTFILEDELECALKCLDQASKQYESLQKDWQLKEANYVQKQVELVSKNDALRAQSQDLSQKLSQVETDFKAYKNQHEGYGDKIIALRSVARALEFENQLLTGEKEHLQQFKTDYCNKNGALKVAVDQVDSLRRQLVLKDEEVKRLRRHCDHEEIEKIKIVQKLAQVEEEVDNKSHQNRTLKSQLSDKEDILEALRVAKRDVEIRLQNQMAENSQLKVNLNKLKQTEEQVDALTSELIMQESVYESRIKDMQRSLDTQIEDIDQNKVKEMDVIKSQYANLFHEKAEEILTLRSDYESVIKKTEQQSRTISDLEYKEKELNTLLSKKQSCHHKEFEQTFQEMQTEIKILQDMTQQSENELMQLRSQVKKFREIDFTKKFNNGSISTITSPTDNCNIENDNSIEDDSGIGPSVQEEVSANNSGDSKSNSSMKKKRNNRRKRTKNY